MSECDDLAGIKVLVVDDSSTIRRDAEIFLGQYGCEVMLATDGFDAMAKIIDGRPDVIFLDSVMPRLDGYQACMLIKRHPKYRSIPVVLLSARSGLFDQARCRIAGSNGHLAKPFSKEALLASVRQHARQCNQS
ncbi:MAG TPA: response regulator [Nitrosomonas halophila]|nr:response regulator [Nitrosomonas halophila]